MGREKIFWFTVWANDGYNILEDKGRKEIWKGTNYRPYLSISSLCMLAVWARLLRTWLGFSDDLFKETEDFFCNSSLVRGIRQVISVQLLLTQKFTSHFSENLLWLKCHRHYWIPQTFLKGVVPLEKVLISKK